MLIGTCINARNYREINYNFVSFSKLSNPTKNTTIDEKVVVGI